MVRTFQLFFVELQQYVQLFSHACLKLCRIILHEWEMSCIHSLLYCHPRWQRSLLAQKDVEDMSRHCPLELHNIANAMHVLAELHLIWIGMQRQQIQHLLRHVLPRIVKHWRMFRRSIPPNTTSIVKIVPTPSLRPSRYQRMQQMLFMKTIFYHRCSIQQ